MLQLPGPVFNTLGDYQGKPMIDVSGAKTYPTETALTRYAQGLKVDTSQIEDMATQIDPSNISRFVSAFF